MIPKLPVIARKIIVTIAASAWTGTVITLAIPAFSK